MGRRPASRPGGRVLLDRPGRPDERSLRRLRVWLHDHHRRSPPERLTRQSAGRQPGGPDGMLGSAEKAAVAEWAVPAPDCRSRRTGATRGSLPPSFIRSSVSRSQRACCLRVETPGVLRSQVLAQEAPCQPGSGVQLRPCPGVRGSAFAEQRLHLARECGLGRSRRHGRCSGIPSRHCIRQPQPGCTWLDETELAAPPPRWPPRLARSPKPVAGWRGQTKTPTPKAVAT